MIRVVGLLLLASSPALAHLDLATVIGRPVTRVEVRNPTRVSDAEIRSLLLISTGDPYSPKAIQHSLALLAQKVEIRNVVVRGELDGDGLILHVDILREPLVRSIRFRGNRSVKRSKLAALLQTKVDRPARDVTLGRDAGSIAEMYETEGFPGAQATWQLIPSSGGDWLRVRFQIEEGEPRRIVGLEVRQEPPIERERLLQILGLKQGDPASRTRLGKGVRRLEDVLRSEGYPEARVVKAHFRAEGAGAVLVLPLHVGERLDVRVEGTEDRRVRPLLDIARSRYGEPIDEAWTDAVAARMVEHLETEGFVQARVIPRREYKYGTRRLVFAVEPGPRVHVDKVTFEGNASIKSRQLRRYMSLVVGGILRPPPFTRGALDRDLKVLKDYYDSRGYLDARVTLLDQDIPPSGKARLRIGVHEGMRYRLGEVAFECDAALPVEDVQRVADVQPGEVAALGELEQARIRLLRELETRGHPQARVEFETSKDSSQAVVHVVFRVRGGPLVRFGNTVVSGNARTRTPVILRELTFTKGEPWNPQEVLRSRQRLYRLGFFRRVRIRPLSESPDGGPEDVIVEVEDQDAGIVDFGIGYATEERLKGSGSISYVNLFGSGRSLGLRADFDRFVQSYAANFREPWLFNRRIDLRLTLLRSLQDRDAFDLTSTAFQAGLEKEITDEILGSLRYTVERDRLSDLADGSDSIDGVFRLISVGPVLAWDSTNDPFNPTRGFRHAFQMEWATDLLGSQVDYERYFGRMGGYFSVGDWTLALLARGGLAFKRGDKADDWPANRRFYLGGRTTVRGFKTDEIGPKDDDDNPIGGDVMVNLKAELRYPLWKKLRGAVFWDAGNVWNRSLGNSDYTELRSALGLGLRYITPVGPLSLDVGHKLDRKRGESSVVWHFTVGNVF